jgi:hypothetical protein
MSQLEMIQREFSQAIFNPQLTSNTPILGHIANTMGPDEQARIKIYRAAILGSFTRVLAEVYPVIARLLGNEFFSAMARLYAIEHPSTQPDLNRYGSQLPEFIQQFEPLSEMSYLVDMARLEWYWHEIFYAADSPPFDFSLLSALGEKDHGSIYLNLPEATRLQNSKFPLLRIWQQNQPEVTDPDEIDLNEGGVYLIIWRSGFDRRIEILNGDQWTLLQAVSKGLSMDSLFDQPKLGRVAGRILPDCIHRGWITTRKTTTLQEASQ